MKKKVEKFRFSQLEQVLEEANLEFTTEGPEHEGHDRWVRYEIKDERYLDTDVIVYGDNLKRWNESSDFQKLSDLRFSSVSVVRKVDFVHNYEAFAKAAIAEHSVDIDNENLSFDNPLLSPYYKDHHYLEICADKPGEVIEALDTIDEAAKILNNAVNTEKDRVKGVLDIARALYNQQQQRK